MNTKSYTPNWWLDKALEANAAAQILLESGRIMESKRLHNTSKYCYKRYERALIEYTLRRCLRTRFSKWLESEWAFIFLTTATILSIILIKKYG